MKVVKDKTVVTLPLLTVNGKVVMCEEVTDRTEIHNVIDDYYNGTAVRRAQKTGRSLSRETSRYLDKISEGFEKLYKGVSGNCSFYMTVSSEVVVTDRTTAPEQSTILIINSHIACDVFNARNCMIVSSSIVVPDMEISGSIVEQSNIIGENWRVVDTVLSEVQLTTSCEKVSSVDSSTLFRTAIKAAGRILIVGSWSFRNTEFKLFNANDVEITNTSLNELDIFLPLVTVHPKNILINDRTCYGTFTSLMGPLTFVKEGLNDMWVGLHDFCEYVTAKEVLGTIPVRPVAPQTYAPMTWGAYTGKHSALYLRISELLIPDTTEPKEEFMVLPELLNNEVESVLTQITSRINLYSIMSSIVK